MKENPEVTTSQMAEVLRVSRQTIATRVKVLQVQGIVRRIGPDKGGHWEVSR
ncbi:MAG: winged helix-turn-helix transcriptional regulator [Bacteroidales bacterium]|nr:winged helix-turn-helix transcriptional regulator [Bacteroidales bacterium]